MTIAFTCIFIAILMPYVWVYVYKFPQIKNKTYDNKVPRLQAQNLSGMAQRALWTHQNHYEALPGFIAAVLVAAYTGAPQDLVDTLAVCFIIARIIFGVCYLKDWHIARSGFWAVGFFSMIGIFMSAY